MPNRKATVDELVSKAAALQVKKEKRALSNLKRRASIHKRVKSLLKHAEALQAP